ncbi:MAG: hypothetical protein U0795_01515 [Pirellulales bacterium]
MMRRSLTCVELGLLVGLVLSSRLAFAEPPAQPEFRISLMEADVVLGDEVVDAPADQPTRARIEKAIADLAKVPGESLAIYLRDGSGLLISETTEGMARLVERGMTADMEPVKFLESQGPAALPLLLEHLDDSTPTRAAELVLPTDRYAVHIWAASNSGGIHEIVIFEELVPGSKSMADFPVEAEKLPITIGDVCAAILGSIVGHDYFSIGSIQGKPYAVGVFCPARHAPAIAILRNYWSKTPLHESLLLDYRARIDPASGMGRNDRQPVPRRSRSTGATERLLLYYPALILPDIVRRLDELDAGYWPEDQCAILECVIRRHNEALRPPLIRLIERSEDGYLLAAALRSPLVGADARERALATCRHLVATVRPTLWWDEQKLQAAIDCLLEHDRDNSRLVETLRGYLADEPVRGVRLITKGRGFDLRLPELWPVIRDGLQNESVASRTVLLDDEKFQEQMNSDEVLSEDEYQIRDLVAFHVAGSLTAGKLPYSLDRRARDRRARMRAELIRRGDLLVSSPAK